LTVNCALWVRATNGACSCAWMFNRPDTPTRRSVPESVSEVEGTSASGGG
jgi:hypothetical protein